MSDLEISVDGGIAVLTINRPEAHNAIGGTLLADFLRAAEDLEKDDSVRAVITTANGRIWCASGDFDDLEQTLGSSADDLLYGTALGGAKGLPILSDQGRRFDRLGIGHWVLRFRQLQKPMIAAITGSTAAGGLVLACLHDFRIAAESARFRSGFLTLGLGPEMGLSWLLPRIVGLPMATEMILANRTLDASEAAAAGLVNQVLPAADVLPSARALAEQLADLAPLGVRATIRALRATADNSLASQLELEWDSQRITLASEDAQSALLALRTGRPTPFFVGR